LNHVSLKVPLEKSMVAHMKKDAGACIYTRQNAGEKTDDGADCNQHSKETNSGFRSENLERAGLLSSVTSLPIKPRTCA